MKQALSLIAFLIFTTSSHAQEDFPEAERKAIAAEVEAMMSAFNNGNTEILLEKTHPILHDLVGGKDAFEKGAIRGVKIMMETGIKIDSLKTELPNKLYKSGGNSVCFVPVSSVMTVGDKKIASTSFMIAAKNKEGEWKYLDGTFVKTNPEQLRTFFPELPKDIDIPEVKIEPLP